MATRIEVLNRINECEKKGEFDVHVDPINYDLVIKVDENFPYIHKGFIGIIKHNLMKYTIVKPFTWYCNKMILKSKIVGKENLKYLKRGIVTSNHVNMWDCLLLKKAFKGHKLSITAAPFNNRSDFLGSLMRAGDMIPLSETRKGMRKFNEAIEYKLNKNNNFILFYPEQAMWWNYEKPRPFKDGAFHYAAKHNVPIIPTFITFQKNGKYDNEGIEEKEFILHIMPPIYPNPKYSVKENMLYLKEKDYQACKEKYESFYRKDLVFENSI